MSILIKNGTIYDGSGQAPYKKDILIRGNIISKIGKISEKGTSATHVIDADGAFIMPGFIDTNSDTDHHLSIFLDPHQEQSLEQGITTVIGGNEGVSLAPLYNDEALQFIEEKAAKHIPMVNIGWETFDEFLDIIQNQGIGINFGSMVGYSTVRRSIARYKNEKVKDREKRTIEKLLRTAVNNGALGISTGFEDFYSNIITNKEIRDVLYNLKDLSFTYTSSLRAPESAPSKSVKNITKLSKKTGIKAHISHIQPIKALSDEYDEIKEFIDSKAEKLPLSFDCHPYLCRKVPIYQFLPESLINEQSLDDILKHINAPEHQETILEHLKTKTRKGIQVVHAPQDIEFFEGKFVKQIASNRGETQAETLLHLMKASSLKMLCLYEDVNKKSLESLMQSNNASIISDGLHLDNLDMSPFLHFMQTVRDKKIMPMEKAIAKLTSIPAQIYGIKRRGRIKEGYYADITIATKDTVQDVIVNGTFALKDREVQTGLTGSVLRNSNG